jgi:hypothetical protein
MKCRYVDDKYMHFMTANHQLRINSEVGKKILANDRILESINSKMNNFVVAVQN